jgi:carboxypeptidase family protein
VSKRLESHVSWCICYGRLALMRPGKLQRTVRTIQAVLILGFLFCTSAFAQSTYGTILGTVKDPGGSVVVGAQILLTNQGTSAQRTAVTDGSGNYVLPNLEQGTYELTIQATGFQEIRDTSLILQARETMRVDGALKVAGQSQSVTVEAGAATVLDTDVSNLAETKTSIELIDLPVALTSRSTGSTSPMTTLTTQPGVQTDQSGNISVGGTTPSMLSMTLDGLSTMGTRAGAPLTELFPSFNGIEEIRVSEFNNSAEYGGISDIATVSKSGSNTYHGGFYDNWQNRDITAKNTFSLVKPALNMNDFGAYAGGPLSIPRLYNGHDRTFFFGSYEGLRLPSTTTVVESVPSLALRSGNLSAYSGQIYNPYTGAAYVNNQIPANQITPVSQNFLTYLYPLPNTGPANSIVNNYTNNFPTPVSSNQADGRIDQNISKKQLIFVRANYKIRSVEVAPTTESAKIGSISQPEDDYGLTVAHNYIFTPSLLNEARAGFNGNHTWTTYDLPAQTIYTELGLTGLSSNLPSGSDVPYLAISGFQATGPLRETSQSNNTTEVMDALTWTKKNHEMKFGAEYRRARGNVTNVDAEYRMGQYNFTGAVTSLTAAGTNHAYIGNPYAAFLLGIPDETGLDQVTNGNLKGYANDYAFYGEDNWRASSTLTFNIGLRWEYHPMFQDHLGNVSNFVPNYTSIINGVQVNGAVILANQAAFGILNPDFAESIAPTPIITAAQAGVPASMRFSDKTDWGPRLGLAWRPFGNNKTVIRGGFGRFIMTPMEGLLSAGFAVHSVDQGKYNQTIVNGRPQFAFPYAFPSNLAVAGSQDFKQAFALHYQDPAFYQWNLTVERDLGYSTGLQMSYIGSAGTNLVLNGNTGQVPVNTIGYAAAQAFAPYPLWAEIETVQNGGVSHYNALNIAVLRRFSHGVQFQSSYTFSRNLSDAQGYDPTSFTGEDGGLSENLNVPRLDYGNVAYTRRHRFLTTGLYQLPFGKNHAYFASTNPVVDQLISGWELSGVIMLQSGPFLTATVPNADPAGVGFPQLIGSGRPDRVAGVAMRTGARSKTGVWLQSAAFAVPANNIGRFGTSSVGSIPGIGTEVVSASLMKNVQIKEGMVFRFGTQAANIFNHVNYAQPNTSLTTSPFGTVSSVQTAEGAGPRAFQMVGIFTF